MTSMNSSRITLAIALLLAGCAAAPIRYHTLATAEPVTPSAPAATTSHAGKPIFIELTPVAVPERLVRPQLVVRRQGSARGSERIDILDDDRWSSPFNSELRDALASGIAARSDAVDVTHGGRPPGETAYRIAVQLRQFDAIPDARVDATFSWTIARSDGGRGAACVLPLSEAVGPGTDALVQGIQRAVGRVAEQIAAQVTQLQSGASANCNRQVHVDSRSSQ
ncbi:membrane integrity-associated transporter subunit PqiC [Noviherbaspirillum cavernae]|uniref:Membrane integrity-associated transporter subunit PqiC n=1 Tax=Noviherbaspirillum cavernae TaxID=2320862 RepID=A0A418WZT8_9BURK|nr:PqiC family protein [Noviherbaspirillum cavernae]RJG05760.1 membrane integrity-associated transporter subunit PqiC [Noviherbaspirillum cavernae]